VQREHTAPRRGVEAYETCGGRPVGTVHEPREPVEQPIAPDRRCEGPGPSVPDEDLHVVDHELTQSSEVAPGEGVVRAHYDRRVALEFVLPRRRRGHAASVDRCSRIRIRHCTEPATCRLRVSGLRARRKGDPADREGTMSFDDLTAREREVAVVAATGASTKSIAERLYVSDRTVESHLGSMYRKLGVSSRPELVVALLNAGIGTAPPTGTPAPPAGRDEGATADWRLPPVPSNFVGREVELGAIRAARRRADDTNRRAVVLVGGEAGVGKSTLIAAAAQEAFADGATVLSGRCDEDLASPFGPFVEAIHPYLAERPDPLDTVTGPLGGALAAVVPELESRLPAMSGTLDAAARPRVLADAIVHVLAAAGRDAPVMLVVDDLQWADRATAALVRRLINSNAPQRLLLAASFRDTDLSRAHPLPGLLADLWRIDDVERIHLGGLDLEDSFALARRLRGDVDEELVRRLHDSCNGNAFFLTRLLHHVATGADGPRSSLPAALRDVVLEDVHRLDNTLIEPLQLAAVQGLEPELAVMEAAAPRAGLSRPNELLSQLERAVGIGVLRESPVTPGCFQFVHDLARQAVLATAGPARLARLHRAIGLAMFELFDDDSARIGAAAAHLARSLDPHDRVLAGELTLRALRNARSELSPDDAAETARASLSTLPGGHDGDAVRLELLLALAEIHGLRLDAHAHRDAVLVEMAVAKRLQRPTDVARALVSFRLVPRMGTVDAEMLELTDAAILTLGPEPSPLRARLVGFAAYQRALGGDGFATSVAAEAAVAEARATGDTSVLADTLFDLAATLLGSDDVERQLTVGGELARVSSRPPIAPGPNHGRRFLGVANLCAGDRRAFEDDLSALAGDADRTRNRVLLAMAATWRAQLALCDGRLETAEAHAGEALAAAGDEPNFRLGWFAQLCSVRAEQLRCSEMATLADGIIAEHGDLVAVRAMVAWLLFADEQPEHAREVLAPVQRAGGLAKLSRDWLLPGTLGLLAPVVAATGSDDDCGQLLTLLDPYVGRMLVLGAGTQVVGAAGRFAAMLSARLGDRDGAATALTRATILEQQFEAPLLVAHSTIDRAQLLSHGDRAARKRAAQLLDDTAAAAARHGWSWVAQRAEAATP
jgi:DNA-binding CsgD family transcriptional regulator